ncbi:hypothetical protein DFH08DRAFT_215240 [Mycena albidolilacea]|uniref:Uncharacterized protein n=1 Tax=Mycena albidolilacea TaxID=1033008 RepID=A0AAD7EPD2_9AGAR|nr:hypothetical protein DFH08DRAFT_215240 [Mycena albidolilacea]
MHRHDTLGTIHWARRGLSAPHPLYGRFVPELSGIGGTIPVQPSFDVSPVSSCAAVLISSASPDTVAVVHPPLSHAVTPWRRCATPCDNVGVVSYMSSPVRSFSFLPLASRVSMLPALAIPHPPTPRRVQTKQRRVRAVVPSAHHLFPLSSRAPALFSGCHAPRGSQTLFSLRSSIRCSSSVLPGATSSRRPPSCSTGQPLANRGIRGGVMRSFSVWSRL